MISDHESSSWLLHVMQSPHSRVPQPAISLSCFIRRNTLRPEHARHLFQFPLLALTSIYQSLRPQFNLPSTITTFNNTHVSIRLPRSQPFPQTSSDWPVHKAKAKPLVSTTTPGRPLRPMYRNHLTSPVLTRYIPVVAAIGLGSCTISHEDILTHPGSSD